MSELQEPIQLPEQYLDKVKYAASVLIYFYTFKL